MSIQSFVPPKAELDAAAGSNGETPAVKRSATELIKENSRNLRGTLALELLEDTDHFSEENKQLLKFHGSYQQDNRDARKSRSKEGVGKHYMFMVRCKIPGGRVTAAQYLMLDELAGAYGNGTLRITSRQGIQLHGVLKKDIKETIAGINQCLLTTLGACGDVERNVIAPPAPLASPLYEQLQETARFLAQHLAPRSRAYHEIWLNGQAVQENPAEVEVEPIYGQTYLPRKFKTGFALLTDNSTDIYAQDLGFLGIVEDNRLVGYNVLVGGGMGMSHGNPNTFPFLARPVCYVPVDKAAAIAEAVLKLFRDHGNRGDRKRARLKYLVFDWGVEKFRQVLSGYVDFPLALPLPVEVTDNPLNLGWHPQGDGKYYYGISVENGRIKDEGTLRLRSGLRVLVQRYQPKVRTTPNQDLILGDLPPQARIDIERTLEEFGIVPPDRLSQVQKHSLACPAIPTCGLAITESERIFPDIIREVEEELKRLGLGTLKMSVRMTGCPNGCARPYQSDIGLVGRSGDKFSVFVGGNVLGNRLNFMLRDLVPQDQLVSLLLPLLWNYKKTGQAGEGFGDYCQRLGLEKLAALLPEGIGKSPSHAPATSAVCS